MSSQVNPDILLDLKKYGVSDATACFNCGNCTAICELTSETNAFPRKVIRYLQLGLEEKLFKYPGLYVQARSLRKYPHPYKRGRYAVSA